MRKTLFLLLISIASMHMYAYQNPNPSINNAPIYNTTINPQFINNVSPTIITAHLKDVASAMLQKTQETFTKENYNNAKNALKTLLWEYRYNITIGTLLTAYSSTNMVLLHDYYYLKDAQRWSRWKSDCTFELLCAISHAELTQELIRSIGEHHYNTKNPADTSHPLITFIATIETEIKTCKRYLTVANTVKKLHLTKIFPINDAKIAQVQRFLERCLFVKHLFLSWLTERNLITKSRQKSLLKMSDIAIQSPYYPQKRPLLQY